MVGEINWSILDPNAPAKAAGSFQQGQANRLAMQQAEQERASNALALQSRQQSMADEQAVRQAYAQAGGDQNKLVESLRGAGQHQKAMEMQGQMASKHAAQRKAQIEQGLQRITVLGQIAGGVNDQATYDAARQQLASLFGQDAVAGMPDAYDPNAVAQFRNQAMTAGQQLEQQWKALDYGMKRDQFGFEKQKFGAQQGLEREKMAQSAAQHAASLEVEREKLGAKAQGIAALAKEKAKLQMAIPQMQTNIDLAVKNIDELIGTRDEKGNLAKGSKLHSGFSQAVGAGVPGLKYAHGTDTADFNARLEQLQGGAFLQAFESLKGGGAITQIEGEKATKAITRMSTAQSEKEFVTAAKEFKYAIQAGLKNAKKAAGVESDSGEWKDL